MSRVRSYDSLYDELFSAKISQNKIDLWEEPLIRGLKYRKPQFDVFSSDVESQGESSQLLNFPDDLSYFSFPTIADEESLPFDQFCLKQEQLGSTAKGEELTSGKNLFFNEFQHHAPQFKGRMDEEHFITEPQTNCFLALIWPANATKLSLTGLAPDTISPMDNLESARFWLRQIYEQNRLFDLNEIAEEPVRVSIGLILPIIFEYYDPQNPTGPDVRTKPHKAKLLIFMRKDQYVKKAWSKLKTTIYARYKGPKTLKSVAQQQIRAELACESEQVFENLFGSGTCDGLKSESIEFILNNDQTFRTIFTNEFFRLVREALNRQTHHDIEINFVNKLDKYLTGSEEGRASATAHFRTRRSVKTPFTFLENNTALAVLVDQFIKKLKNMQMPRSEKESRMRALNAIRSEIREFAEKMNWTLPGCAFKRSEIVSFIS